MDNNRTKYLKANGYWDLSKIKPEDVLDLLIVAKKDLLSQMEAIYNNPDEPTFHNTIVPYECSGRDYETFINLLSNYRTSLNSDLITDTFKKVNKLATDIDKHILFNPKLSSRVFKVYEKEKNSLSGEDLILLTNVYKYFSKDGANLPKHQQKRLSKINEELSNLSLKYSNNLQKDQESNFLHLSSEEQLKGLNSSFIKEFKNLTKKKKAKGLLVPLDEASVCEVLEKCEVRETRRLIFEKDGEIGNNKNKYNNTQTVKKILSLSHEKALLLGYKNYAELVLDDRICNSPKKVKDFLTPVLNKAMPKVKESLKKYESYAKKLGISDIRSYDLDYIDYKKSLKKKNKVHLREYFSLDNVFIGLKSFLKITFKIELEETNLKSYHKDVVVYKVLDNGKTIGFIHWDLFQRDKKDSGAWMNPFISAGSITLPQVQIALNLRKSKPHLLDLEDVKTVYHEMGHALHAICSKTKYRMLGGINVAWDFVELPSQLMENFLGNKEFVSSWAKHYLTNKKLSKEELKSLSLKTPLKELSVRSITLRSLLDLKYYTTNPSDITSLYDFENELFKKYSLSIVKDLPKTIMGTNFDHIFGGGYESGYYSYLFAEMLDSDAYQKFKKVPYKKWGTIGSSFKNEVLERGSSRPEMDSFTSFKGSEPVITHLLKRYGI